MKTYANCIDRTGQDLSIHAMIEIQRLRFRYPRSEFQLSVDGFSVRPGEKVAIVGPSGSGKTTLLNLIAGIVVAQSGSISVDGQPISNLHDRQRRDFRIAKIGMVFQQFELIEYLRTIDNILLPYLINDCLLLNSKVKEFAVHLAGQVGLVDKLARRPKMLSQGEQQRVAICRALVTRPELVLADEPTGNLDPKNKLRILDILFEQCDSSGQTLLLVTHDMSILEGFDRVVDFEQFRVDVDLDSSAVTEATA